MKKTFIRVLGVVLLSGAFLQLSPTVQAGRMGGPMTRAGTVPAFQSVYFDIAFAEGEPAMVTMAGRGNATLVHLLVFDSDGHVFEGVGGADRKTVTFNVNRGGVFRVEVRNLGSLDGSFVLATN
jgi:hypothetical protein